MSNVKVTVLQTHYGSQGKMRKGQEYSVTEKVAAQLIRDGLVSGDVPPAAKQEGTKINVSDKPKKEKVETPAETPEKVESPQKKNGKTKIGE